MPRNKFGGRNAECKDTICALSLLSNIRSAFVLQFDHTQFRRVGWKYNVNPQGWIRATFQPAHNPRKHSPSLPRRGQDVNTSPSVNLLAEAAKQSPAVFQPCVPFHERTPTQRRAILTSRFQTAPPHKYFFCECGVQARIHLSRNSLPLPLTTLRAIRSIRAIGALKLLCEAIQIGRQPMLGRVSPGLCRA